ncbi:hypothetical protein [Streptomyces rubradiris]|uniref:hypothetical protein n=1 Tax=Streptomyces rubradiris TaxID=285531 RepID=UPI003571708C
MLKLSAHQSQALDAVLPALADWRKARENWSVSERLPRSAGPRPRARPWACPPAAGSSSRRRPRTSCATVCSTSCGPTASTSCPARWKPACPGTNSPAGWAVSSPTTGSPASCPCSRSRTGWRATGRMPRRSPPPP